MPSAEFGADVAERSPRGNRSDDESDLEFYKSQIQQLEDELKDFQESSRELEKELEKELEASEKSHRNLQQKNDALKYEVDEWKVSKPVFSMHMHLFFFNCR